MSRPTAWSVHVATLLVGISGLVFAWMRYLVEPRDEFAVVNHPLEPTFRHLHVLTAPLLVFVVGVVWRDHAWARIRSGFRLRRRTGIALALLFGPMAASGYALQVSVDDTWRTVWVWVHVASSVAWLAGYGAHRLLVTRSRPRAPRAGAPASRA